MLLTGTIHSLIRAAYRTSQYIGIHCRRRPQQLHHHHYHHNHNHRFLARSCSAISERGTISYSSLNQSYRAYFDLVASSWLPPHDRPRLDKTYQRKKQQHLKHHHLSHHHFLQQQQQQQHLTQLRFYHTTPTNMVQGVVIDETGCIVNVNPATGEIISHVPCTPVEHVDPIFQSARDAIPHWSTETPLEERIQCLRQGLDHLETRQELLVSLIVQEMGKPIAEAQDEVKWALSKRGEYLDLLQSSLQPQHQPPGGNTLIVRQALGVVVILSPWNFPADEILLLALPALGAGNVVIVKPSEVTPETGALVVACLAQALPAGVLQLAQGDGQVGAALVSHPDVNLIAMTGSSATGRRIFQSAATGATMDPLMMSTTDTAMLSSSSSPPPLKRVVLEMGGKDPMIVFADADIDVAARHAVAYSLANTGQVCCSIERIYVAESIYDDFSKRVAGIAATYPVGNGQDPNVKVGPMVSPIQRQQVETQVQDALERGAKLLFQSDIPGRHETSENTTCFFPVTVLGDVTHEMEVFRRETFGPVVALSVFDGTEASAIRLANQTEYGLASSVYTKDLAKAQRVASAIVAGQVGINCYAIEHMNVHCPWVGHKNSGFGFHSGVDGFHQLSIPKTIVFPNS